MLKSHVKTARAVLASCVSLTRALLRMPCSICLEEYTAADRPAALPCGHIFHEPCVRDWLSTRAITAQRGCPLCKAPAHSDQVLLLWPNDASDFAQYVAAHTADASVSSSSADLAQRDVLLAATDFVQALQSYAMAAHGFRALPMKRAIHKAQEAVRRGAVREEHAAEQLLVRSVRTQLTQRSAP